MKANGNDAAARFQLGEAYLKQGEIKQAREEHKVLQGPGSGIGRKLLRLH